MRACAVAHRRERVAHLVREHGEDFIARAHRLLALRKELADLERVPALERTGVPYEPRASPSMRSCSAWRPNETSCISPFTKNAGVERTPLAFALATCSRTR
jgi:hypothetical protein